MKKRKERLVRWASEKDTMRPNMISQKRSAASLPRGTQKALTWFCFDPDVAELFPDSRAANEALRTIARLMRTSPPKRPGTRTP